MGAELLGWLAKGPMKLRVSRKHKRQIIRQLTLIADWWRILGEDTANCSYSPSPAWEPQWASNS